jgi:hypothetical protein
LKLEDNRGASPVLQNSFRASRISAVPVLASILSNFILTPALKKWLTIYYTARCENNIVAVKKYIIAQSYPYFKQGGRP